MVHVLRVAFRPPGRRVPATSFEQNPHLGRGGAHHKHHHPQPPPPPHEDGTCSPGQEAEADTEVDADAATGTTGLVVLFGGATTFFDFTSSLDVFDLDGGAAIMGSRQPGYFDIRTGSQGTNSSVTLTTQLRGGGHAIDKLALSFRYVAGCAC